MKTPDEIKKGLIEPELFCDHCEYYGEPNGCNRPNGSCKAYDNADDAYKLIQQLAAQVPKWISVEERLPDCRVLAINDRGVVAVGKIGQFYDRGENVYVCDEWDSNIGIIHVTHWMPLPEPPKEDDE